MISVFNTSYKFYFILIVSLLSFLLTANTLLPIPVDKIVILLISFWCLINIFHNRNINEQEFIIYASLVFVILASLLVNIRSFSFQVFLPLVGLIFSLYLAKSSFLFLSIYYGSFLHILIGSIFAICSYVYEPNNYVSNLAYKGVPFLNSAMGFTPTPQTFGTLCLTWLVMYFFIKENYKITKLDRFFYILVSIAIFLTVNRTTIIGYLLIIFFKNRKLFLIYFILLITLSGIFFDILYDTLFNINTLQARDELLEGFNKSFWDSHSVLIYLFGRADNKLTENITKTVTWDYRNDIENGYAMILHMYGFNGIAFYLSATTVFILKLLKAAYFYEFFICAFFLLFSSYITQEYVATTFYIILGVIIYMYNFKHTNNLKLNGQSKTL